MRAAFSAHRHIGTLGGNCNGIAAEFIFNRIIGTVDIIGYNAVHLYLRNRCGRRLPRAFGHRTAGGLASGFGFGTGKSGVGMKYFGSWRAVFLRDGILTERAAAAFAY